MSMPTLHIASPFSAALPVSGAPGGEPSSRSNTLAAVADGQAGEGPAARPPAPHILPPGASSAMDLVANIPAMTDGSRASLETVTEEYGREADAAAAPDDDPPALTVSIPSSIQPEVA